MFARRDFFLLTHGASIDVSSCTMVPEPNDHAMIGTLVAQGPRETCSEESHVLRISCNPLFETPMGNQATIMNHFLDMMDYDTRPAFFVPRQTTSSRNCVDLVGTPQSSPQNGPGSTITDTSGSTSIISVIHSLTTISLGHL